ncbi:uncharacterized protein LOC111617664 [Centruroides sculpturatus]|uniref:uncharacterized protein LOC111617664 n=1 Tax=Centruroides sculpturatus TaxID=218467 RepID=UPI000C6DB0DB|nr:uncharacterized protein LOC111617664 [Centruroides sculpturatus]
MNYTYFPAKPTSSLYLQRRYQIKQHEEHLERIRNAKSVVDNKPPATFWHTRLNLKKLQPVKNVLKVAKNNKEVKKNVDRRKVVSKSNFNKGSDKMDKTKKFHDNSEYTEERTDVDEENIINEESDDYESDKERIVSDGEVSSSEEDILDRLIGSLMEGNDNGICDSSRKCRNKQKPKTPVYQINSNKNYKFKKFIKPNRNKI